MTDMQQILAGMNELNEKGHKMPKPEQLKLSDKLSRYSWIASWSEEKGKVQKCHYNRSKGSARLRRSTSRNLRTH